MGDYGAARPYFERALAIDDEQVLLWQEDQGDPRVTALDATTGRR